MTNGIEPHTTSPQVHFGLLVTGETEEKQLPVAPA